VNLCNANTKILLSYEERQSEEKLAVMKKFFELMKPSFIWSKVPFECHHPQFRSPDIQIVKFHLAKIREIEN